MGCTVCVCVGGGKRGEGQGHGSFSTCYLSSLEWKVAILSLQMPVNVQHHCEKIQTKQQLQDHLCVTHSFQELTTVSVVCIHKFSQQYMHLTHGPFLTKQVTAGNKIKGNTKSKAEHYSSSFTRTDSTLGQKKKKNSNSAVTVVCTAP